MFPKSKGIFRRMLRYLTEPQPYWTLEKFREKWGYRHPYIVISGVIGVLATVYFLLALDSYIGASVIVLITVVAVALEVKAQKKSEEKWMYIDLYTSGVLIMGWVLIGLTIAYFLLAVDNYIGASVIVFITAVALGLEVKALIYLNRKIKNHR